VIRRYCLSLPNASQLAYKVGVATLNTRVRPCLVSNKDHLQALVPRTGKDKYPDSDDRFDNAPYFNFDDDRVKFDTNWFNNANDNYGSASGFVPKSSFISKRYPFGYLLRYREVLLERIQPPSILPISSTIS